MTKFCCDYCHTPIGHVDLDKLAEPMAPDMFSSLNPARGIPDPFHPSLTWIDFHCPYCRLRPFQEPNEITLLVDEKSGKKQRYRIDKINIEQKTREANQSQIDQAFAEAFVCPKCGKEYAHQSSLSRHVKVCNG